MRFLGNMFDKEKRIFSCLTVIGLLVMSLLYVNEVSIFLLGGVVRVLAMVLFAAGVKWFATKQVWGHREIYYPLAIGLLTKAIYTDKWTFILSVQLFMYCFLLCFVMNLYANGLGKTKLLVTLVAAVATAYLVTLDVSRSVELFYILLLCVVVGIVFMWIMNKTCGLRIWLQTVIALALIMVYGLVMWL